MEKKGTFFKEVWELNLSSRRWSKSLKCELKLQVTSSAATIAAAGEP